MASSDGDNQADRYHELQPISSSYTERRRHRVFESFLNNDNTSRMPTASRGTQGDQLILILGLLNLHKGTTFSVEQNQKWNLRRALGEGVSFKVTETDMPIWSALSHLRYRSLNLSGPGEKFHFVDHTNTSWDINTVVAYKSIAPRTRGMDSVLSELRVMYHPPLQRHPNIVSVLGVAWAMELETNIESSNSAVDLVPPFETSGQREPLQEWPSIVIERAPHSSLPDFLSTSKLGVRISLRAKFRLCGDVLNAITALHGCGIVHGDIKCENVLVFDGPSSTAESWIAKLSDFGHSTMGLHGDGDGEDERLHQAMVGTRFFSPPELDGGPIALFKENFERIDIWCWGMLLWRVMIEDTEYLDSNGQKIEDRMIMLRQKPTFAKMASQSCRRYLSSFHEHERPLAYRICEILRRTLDYDPLSRPSSRDLLAEIEGFSGERYIPVLRPSGVQPVTDIPYFDLSNQYYDLIAFPTLPMQIFALLENSQKEDDTDDNLYSMLQLGLCYLVGFGTSVNANAGIELVDRAASKGLAKAQAVSMRLHSTLGIPISDHYQLAVRDWLRNGASLGSQVALDDLTYHFPAEVKRLGKGKEKAIIIQDPANTSVFASDSSLDTSNLGECLLLACRQDDNAVARQLIEQMGNDAVKDCRGRFGESPLHWAVYSSEGAPSALLMFLMKNNVDLHLETDSECPLSEVDNFCNTIPARTTAFEWAILKDDANLVQNLLSMDLDFIPQLHITRYICLSARYQCIKVLRYLCSIIGPDHLPPTDIYGFSAFYYAIRPDIFDRMLRLRPGDYTDRQYPPYIARQAEVIELLLKMGHTIQVHKENLFTCIHLLVSVGSTEILKIVLQDKSCRELVNVESAFGGTPLKDAIVPGNTEAFNLLMEYGANPNMVWKEKQYHALHVCAMCPGSQAVNFAKKLVARDSFCLERLDYNRSKPLHIAAEYGHQMLANFLVEKGAALLDVNSSGLTPLGMAVKARFIGLTQLLMRKHMEQKLEQIAAGRGMDWSEIQIKEASALKFLLTPGKFSPTQPNPLPFQRGDTRLGCFDFPFSPLSVRLLAVLLEEHREPIWTSGFQPFIFWFRATYDPYTFASGLYEAIKVGNLEALRMIIESTRFDPDLRDLIGLAYHQRQVGSGHIATEEERKVLIDYLENLNTMKFQETRSRRVESQILGLIWRLYYKVYGDIEQRQYEGLLAWRLNTPFHLGDYQWPLEFNQWYHPRFPVYTIAYIFLWILLLPLTICFAILASQPNIEIWRSNINRFVLVLVLINIDYMWPRLNRVVLVYFNHRRGFQDRNLLRGLVAFMYIGFLVLSGYICLVFGTMNPKTTSDYSGPFFILPISTMPLSERQSQTLNTFQSLSTLLMSWTIITLIPFQFTVPIFAGLGA